MGKIRIKTIGDESQEEAEKKKAEVKRAEKMARETASEAIEQPEQPQPEPAASSQQPEAVKRPKKKFAKAKKRSANYKAKVVEIDKNKVYSLPEALELLRKVKMAKFDETVELHINTTQAGISGQVKLPHGSGKEIRIAIATDELIEQIEKGPPRVGEPSESRRGKIDFDILIATPVMMPKLARVAKILGPRGLMPNPKNGTISDNPEEAMKKFQGGQISFKTESKIPVMHVSVGKTSFENNQLAENIKTIIQAVKKDRITQIVLKSTMSPGIRLQV